MLDARCPNPRSRCHNGVTGTPGRAAPLAGHNLFSINELSRVALERCATARCAVKTMGRLAEEYGFYGDDSGDPVQGMPRPSLPNSSTPRDRNQLMVRILSVSRKTFLFPLRDANSHEHHIFLTPGIC